MTETTSICGKICYPSKAQAAGKIRHLRPRTKRQGHKQTRAYFCRACQAWHITSSGVRE